MRETRPTTDLPKQVIEIAHHDVTVGHCVEMYRRYECDKDQCLGAMVAELVRQNKAMREWLAREARSLGTQFVLDGHVMELRSDGEAADRS